MPFLGKKASMRHLVVGGTGFVGLELVRALRARGDEVAVLRRGLTPAPLPPGVESILAPREAGAALAAALAGRRFDCIFDLLAFSAADVDGAFPAFAPAAPHIILLSSTALYRDPLALPIREEDAVGRDYPYAFGKQAAEARLWELAAAAGLAATVVRSNEVIGARDSAGRRGIYLFARLSQGLPLLVPGRLETRANYVAVEDLAALLAALPRNPACRGRIYNAGGEVFTFAEFLAAHVEVMRAFGDLGAAAEVRVFGLGACEFPAWEHFGAFEWHHNCFVDAIVCWQRAHRELGYRPRRRLYEALASAYDELRRERPALLAEPPADPARERALYGAGWAATLPPAPGAPAAAPAPPPEVEGALAGALEGGDLFLLAPLAAGRLLAEEALLAEARAEAEELLGAAALGHARARLERLAGLGALARDGVGPQGGALWRLTGAGLIALLEATARVTGDPLAERPRRTLGLRLRLEARAARALLAAAAPGARLGAAPEAGPLAEEVAERCGSPTAAAAHLEALLALDPMARGWLARLEAELAGPPLGLDRPRSDGAAAPPSEGSAEGERAFLLLGGATPERLSVPRHAVEAHGRAALRRAALEGERALLARILHETS
jgi:nucleoside-diphosphate-sugar epimerase